ncbi:MAG TPA: Flp pilus assembly protein CpaB [Bryobacteraceae bacterium]|nr:Flp pilus assembly protein CpaB [Bryobacteraceae bacterium]
MKKNNTLKLLGIAFVVAIMSTGIFYGLFVNKLSSSTGSGKTVVVAARALKSGTVIAAADLKTIQWPGAGAPKGTFDSPDQVVGKTVFDAIAEDDLVSDSHLASAQSGGGSGVPSGMRAVTIHVTDSSGVIGMLRPGQKVDVQVVLGKGGTETTVRTALEDLRVLAVGPTPEGTSQGTILPSVTLLAAPSQADVLAAADSGARVRLTLRNPLDDQLQPSSAVTLGAVIHATPAAAPKQTAAASTKH